MFKIKKIVLKIYSPGYVPQNTTTIIHIDQVYAIHGCKKDLKVE